MRVRPLVFSLLLVACGSGDDPDSDTDGGAAVACESSGDVDGCLVYETSDCGTDASLKDVPGGHFYLEGTNLFVVLAAHEGRQITFQVVDNMGLANDIKYDIPTQVITTIDDTTDPDEPVSYLGCGGQLTITKYEEGNILWGNFGFKAASVTGVCDFTDYYTVQGEFVGLPYCASASS